MGYDVEYASDGVEAVEKYKEAKDKDPFDLVIMDLTIPGGMGGTEAIKILKSIDPDIKAVVSSGYSNDPVLSDYKKFGFKDIVKKPYRLEVLSDTIENALNS
jgi:CheY-like chemotaxis protein